VTPEQRYRFVRRQLAKAVREERGSDLTRADYPLLSKLAREIVEAWRVSIERERRDAVDNFVRRQREVSAQ
jgi:hypothetical protein